MATINWMPVTIKEMTANIRNTLISQPSTAAMIEMIGVLGSPLSGNVMPLDPPEFPPPRVVGFPPPSEVVLLPPPRVVVCAKHYLRDESQEKNNQKSHRYLGQMIGKRPEDIFVY